MKLSRVLLLSSVVFAVVVLFTGAMAAPAVEDSIEACLKQADGTQTTLTCEQVMWRGKSGKSFAIKEWSDKWPSTPRLLVVSKQPLPVEAYWSVDVTGTLSTLTRTALDGTQVNQRVLIVSPSDVQIYCSRNGGPAPCAVFKGFTLPAYMKRPLTEIVGTVASSITTMSEELPPLPDEPDPPLPSPGSRDTLKWLPDGAQVAINGAIVTATIGDYFYVERSDRSFGIRINSPLAVAPGMLLDIKGSMTTSGGERAIVPVEDGILPADFNMYPLPMEVYLNNRSLGGGAVGPFTPAVGDGAGLNNTGLLVKTSGRVTHVDSANRIYYLDDGSGVSADEGRVGVKVYNLTSDSLPAQDSYCTVTGVSASEIPEGSSTSIRTLWRTASVAPSTQAGTGTISGTVYAVGANGKKVRLYCSSASTTATFSGDAASYSLNVPYGSHAVTASIAGYKTSTQLVTVDALNPNPTCNFTLTTIDKLLDLVAIPKRVPPDGVSEMTITTIVRDEEGRRFGNEPVTWQTDIPLERIISKDTETDNVGEARLVVRAPSTVTTEAVSVTCGDLSGRLFAEFADADAPSIWITSPGNGSTVSGDVEIGVYFDDPGGATPGVSTVTLFVDGVQYSSRPATLPYSWWRSYKVPNGSHEFKATATDYDGNTVCSNVVTVVSENDISEFSITPEEVALGQPVQISAKLATTSYWRISVKDVDDNEVWSTTGTGTTINANWPGTTTTGFFTASVSIMPDGPTYEWPVVCNPTGVPAVLFVAEEYEFLKWWNKIKRLARIVKNEGLSYTVLTPMNATWDNALPILQNTNCRYFYLDCHGNYEAKAPAGSNLPDINVSHLFFNSSGHIVYAYRWEGAPPPESTDPYHNKALGWDRDYKVAYMEDVNRSYWPMKLVWINACLNGRIGAYRSVGPDYYWGMYGIYSCYETNGWNDMAWAFGITPETANMVPCAYISWYDVGISGDYRYDGESDQIPGLIVSTWGTLANGYSFGFTRQWLQDYRSYYMTPIPDDDDNPLHPNVTVVAPFFNWRFWGNNNVPLF